MTRQDSVESVGQNRTRSLEKHNLAVRWWARCKKRGSETRSGVKERAKKRRRRSRAQSSRIGKFIVGHCIGRTSCNSRPLIERTHISTLLFPRPLLRRGDGGRRGGKKGAARTSLFCGEGLELNQETAAAKAAFFNRAELHYTHLRRGTN